MLPLILAGLGLGGVKSVFDQMREGREKKLAGETERYGPWTGMKSKPIQRADWFGNLLQGGLLGATLGQSGLLGGAEAAAEGAGAGASSLGGEDIYGQMASSRMPGVGLKGLATRNALPIDESILW